MRPTLVKCALGCGNNVGRRRKIRLADFKMNDLLAFGLKRSRADQHIKGPFSPKARHAISKPQLSRFHWH